jgi:hypothetical protein
LVGIGSLFSGCASLSGAESKQNLAQLQYGMSKAQVLNMLGTPDSVIQQQAGDRWVYEYRTAPKKGHNIFVDFKNGELAKTGELSGREIAAAEESRIPGTCTKWTRPDLVQESLCTK